MQDFFYIHMKKYYKFNWYSLNLHIDCTKCGNKVVLQEITAKPVCNDCGFTHKSTWVEVLREVGVRRMLKDNGEHCQLIGNFNASANTERSPSIPCYHCKASVDISDDADLRNYACSSCNQPLVF